MRVQRRDSGQAAAGFTLVELLVTMVLSVVIIVVIYSAFKVQQRSYTAQDAVSEMQQNIRVAVMLMSNDLRMASFDTTGDADAGFIAAEADALAFTADLNEDGDTDDAGENMGYDLYNELPAGSGNWTLGRFSSSALPVVTETPVGSGHYEVGLSQPLADNIQALEFNYLDQDGAQLPFPVDQDDIVFIQISILARARQPDPEYSNTQTYTTGSGAVWGPYNDNLRRRLLITTVNCRNMGL